jgi:hypothetical protein
MEIPSDSFRHNLDGLGNDTKKTYNYLVSKAWVNKVKMFPSLQKFQKDLLKSSSDLVKAVEDFKAEIQRLDKETLK